MDIIIGWIVLSLLVGVVADKKGRSGGSAFLLSLVLSPIIGFLVVLALGDRKVAREVEALNRQLMRDASPLPPAPSNTRPCPRCAEDIKRAAKICRFCQAEVEPLPPAPRPPEPQAAPRNPKRARLDAGDGLMIVVVAVMLLLVGLVAGVTAFGTNAETTFGNVAGSMAAP